MDQATAVTVGDLLVGERREGKGKRDENQYQRRESAVEYLYEQGFDTGSSGYNGSNTKVNPREAGGDNNWEPANRIYPIRNPANEAGELQQQAEQRHIEDITHDERYRLACRLLSIGTWDAVWKWFQQQYGTEFKPEVTHEQLSNIVNQYPENYSHIDVEVPS